MNPPPAAGGVDVWLESDQIQLMSTRPFTALIMSVDLDTGDGAVATLDVAPGRSQTPVPLPRSGNHVEVVDSATGEVLASFVQAPRP